MRPILAILMLNFVAAALTNAEYSWGQTTPDDITLGTVRLILGMAQDAVLTTLGKSYELQKLNESQQFSSWAVTARTSANKLTPPKHVGSVAFRQGKLTSVMKNWAPENQQKGFEFATSLYDVITSFTNEGRTVCSIETGRKNDLGYDAKTIFIICGAKHIRIDLLSGPERDAVMMSEVLGEN